MNFHHEKNGDCWDVTGKSEGREELSVEYNSLGYEKYIKVASYLN